MGVNIWRPIDAIADWIRNTLGVQPQMRMGVLMVLAALPLLAYGFFTDEPFLVFQMSAAALLFAGIGVVVTAETLAEVAQDVDELEDDHEKCSACGQNVPTA